MRASIVVGAALTVLAAAGCRDAEAPITREELPQLVLGDADLPRPWSAFDRGRQVRADAVPGSRGDPARAGRIDGWKSRYRRPGTAETRGALVLESRSDLFSSSGAAADDLDAYEAEFASELAQLRGERLEGIDVGDEAVGVTFVQPGAERGVRFFRLAWRRANATASLTANGFDGQLELNGVLALARKQDARLERAASD